MSEKPFQDYWKHNKCWGCGNNEHGLQIKSYWEGDVSICVWEPHKHHMAGPVDVLNGGIISSVIDCHAVGSAIANEYKIDGRELDSLPLIWCVTHPSSCLSRRRFRFACGEYSFDLGPWKPSSLSLFLTRTV